MKKTVYKFLMVFSVLTFFGSCEENAIPELTVDIPETAAKVKFFFHADDAPAANFYFEGEKVTAANSTTAGAEQGLAFKAVYPSNAYAVVPSGSTEVAVEDLEGNVLATTQTQFNADSSYSAFLVGTAGNYEIFINEDVLPADDPVKIYWRFVNTMADMPFDVDVYAVRAATQDNAALVVPLGTGIGFKEGGDYHELVPGNYTFKVFESGTEYDPLTSTPYVSHSVNLASLGRTYTTQIRGTYTETPGSNNIDFWRER